MILGSWPVLQDLVQANLLISPLPHRVVTDIGYDLVISEHAAKRPDVQSFVAWITEAARL